MKTTTLHFYCRGLLDECQVLLIDIEDLHDWQVLHVYVLRRNKKSPSIFNQQERIPETPLFAWEKHPCLLVLYCFSCLFQVIANSLALQVAKGNASSGPSSLSEVWPLRKHHGDCKASAGVWLGLTFLAKTKKRGLSMSLFAPVQTHAQVSETESERRQKCSNKGIEGRQNPWELNAKGSKSLKAASRRGYSHLILQEEEEGGRRRKIHRRPIAPTTTTTAAARKTTCTQYDNHTCPSGFLEPEQTF